MSSPESSGDRETAAAEDVTVTDAADQSTVDENVGVEATAENTAVTDTPDQSTVDENVDVDATAENTATGEADGVTTEVAGTDTETESAAAQASDPESAVSESSADGYAEDETVEITAEEVAAVTTPEDAAETADAADDDEPHVSSRVRVTLEDGTVREGEIIDDFADLAPGDKPVEARIDHEHVARLRRWAISTDDHDIVFADDDAVELISA
ncbi:hypothetical protein [Gordonia paraffinivorans]|uniref:hypothetical protein n=1 Tax=Gordonia paraffinivorans TaxID=175628 RepID=UPI001E570A61|nr:hypothetical protein [Gordonia paraffinivorans]MCD2146577.1 hypothetical protein [Gordonia paraffinivorans]